VFVEIPSQPEGNTAIVAFNDKALRHMTINAIEAIPLSGKKVMAFILPREVAGPIAE
jgi:hypothetical protein